MYDQYKTIKMLSTSTHDCNSHTKNIVSEWIQTHLLLQVEEVAIDLTDTKYTFLQNIYIVPFKIYQAE